MSGVYGCHYSLGNVPNKSFGNQDVVNELYARFFSRENYAVLIRQLEAMQLGSPDWRSLTPHMKRVFGMHPGTYCMSGPLTREKVAEHIILLNRRTLDIVIPIIKVNIQSWNGYLRDRQGLTLIDRGCSDGYKKKWNPVRLDRRLY